MWALGLKSLKEDLTDLLKDDFSSCFGLDGKNDARKVESVSTWVPQLVNHCVKEAQPCLIIQSLNYLLESICVPLLPWSLCPLLGGGIGQM
jgi:hypothetical protein